MSRVDPYLFPGDVSNKETNDVVLWNAFKLGDEEAFAEIYEDHYPALYAYGKKFMGDATSAEDSIQELFVNLWRTKANLSEVTNIKFYLFRCLRRNIYKQQQKEEKVGQASFEVLLDLDSQHWDEPVFDERILTEKIKTLLQSLPERQLEAITLRYYENFSNREIAEIMNISEKTVRNTLYNALVQLRESLRLLNPYMHPLLLLSMIL